MKGLVDNQLRALVTISVAATESAERHETSAWIDTAFNGSLVIPQSQVDSLGLVKESSAEAILADGNTVELETFACFVDWFGKIYETQIVVNDSQYALLGTMLLAGHHLEIDYEQRTVMLR